MFKKLLLFLLCVFGLGLSAHAETVRISGLFNSTTGTTSYNDGQSYCMSASLGGGRTPTGYIGIGSDKSTIVCSFVNSDGSPSQMGVKHYCLKGGQADTAQFGCYGEKPANSCPAAGTIFQAGSVDGEVSSVGTFCSLGCEVMAEVWFPDESSSTGWTGGGNMYYTGNDCTEGDGSGSGGEDGDGDGGDGDGGDGDGGDGDGGDGDGSGDGDGGDGDGGDGDGGDGDGGDGDGGDGDGGDGDGGDGGGSGSGGEGDGEGEGEEGSSWGGSCEQGFSCEGDALVCAISQAEYRRNCEFIDNPEKAEEQLNVFNQAKGENLGSEFGDISDALPGTSVSIKDYIDTSSATGSGRCMRDHTFTWNGNTFTLPLSDLCDLLGWIGTLIVGMSMILALRIAFAGGV